MPSTYDFSYTRDQLITDALLHIGAIGEEDTPTTSQVTNASRILNAMVKAWQADGLQLWARKQTSKALTSGVASYTIGTGLTIDVPRPLRLLNAYIRDSATGVDTPLSPMPKQTYEELSLKTSSGTSSNYYYDPQLTNATIYLYPVVDTTTKTLHITYHSPFADFDSSTDTPDFPQEWYQAIKINLAYQIAPSFSVSIRERTLLRQEAMEAKASALGFDAEDTSVIFTPAIR